jgi:tetratricopeptide (TPR) repeat protein
MLHIPILPRFVSVPGLFFFECVLVQRCHIQRYYFRGCKVSIALYSFFHIYIIFIDFRLRSDKQKGEYIQAMEYYQKVYELQLEHNAETLELANTLSNIGYTKQQLEDLDGALEANQECLRLRRDVFGDTHEDVASALTHIALVLLNLERHDIALQVFMEAYRIRKTIPIRDTSNLAFTIYNIAHIYHHQGSHDNALKFYLATAEVEKGLGIAHLDLSITYYNIGQLFYQRGEMEALEIERECYGANHPTCARTLNEIGNIEMQLGNLEGMMKCYTKALRIYKEAGMINEPVIVYSLKLWRFNIVHPEAAPVA